MSIASIDEVDRHTIPRIDTIRDATLQRAGGPGLDKSRRGETKWPGLTEHPDANPLPG